MMGIHMVGFSVCETVWSLGGNVEVGLFLS
jgi:hypothetical protein